MLNYLDRLHVHSSDALLGTAFVEHYFMLIYPTI